MKPSVSPTLAQQALRQQAALAQEQQHWIEVSQSYSHFQPLSQPELELLEKILQDYLKGE